MIVNSITKKNSSEDFEAHYKENFKKVYSDILRTYLKAQCEGKDTGSYLKMVTVFEKVQQKINKDPNFSITEEFVFNDLVREMVSLNMLKRLPERQLIGDKTVHEMRIHSNHIVEEWIKRGTSNKDFLYSF